MTTIADAILRVASVLQISADKPVDRLQVVIDKITEEMKISDNPGLERFPAVVRYLREHRTPESLATDVLHKMFPKDMSRDVKNTVYTNRYNPKAGDHVKIVGGNYNGHVGIVESLHEDKVIVVLNKPVTVTYHSVSVPDVYIHR